MFIVPPAMSQTGCVWGDCKDGIGKYVSKSNWYNIATYSGGKKDGVGLYFYDDGYMSACLVRYSQNYRNGLQICLWDGANVTYRYFNEKGSRTDEPYLRVDPDGNVIEYGITKSKDKARSASEVLALTKLRSDRALMLSDVDPVVRKYIPLGLANSPIPTETQYALDADSIVLPSTKESYTQKELTEGGWDLSGCGKIPKSRYTVGNTSDYIPVTFVNDTGSRVRPAFADLDGNINFLASRADKDVWEDQTYIGTNWVWFSAKRSCLGWSASRFEWSDSYQLISKVAQ